MASSALRPEPAPELTTELTTEPREQSTASRGRGSRRSRVPVWAGQVLWVGAALAVLHAVGHVRLLYPFIAVWSALFLDITTRFLAWGVFLVLLGAGLLRRKRIAWWMLVALLVAQEAVNAVILLVLALSGDLVTSLREAPLEGAGVLLNTVMCGVWLGVLVWCRAEFTARFRPGNVWRSALVLVVGLAVTVGVCSLLVWLTPDGRTHPGSRLGWLLIRLLDAGQVTGGETPLVANWIVSVGGVLMAATLLLAVMMLLRSQTERDSMSATDEARVRGLLRANPEDSLGYFATRHDKSVVFSPDGNAAIAYRVVLGTCVAAGDPLGEEEFWPGAIAAWRSRAQEFGWSPAVVGASDRGGRAFEHAGFHVLQIGDEAVLEARTFSLTAAGMRPVRRAVERVRRSGVTFRARRHGDLDALELRRLGALADSWRDTETERGFSMALGRWGDVNDADCLVAEALDADGTTVALLSFVPWGNTGYSLDVMRRSPEAPNGVTEFLVAGMFGGDVAEVQRVSLNFAVFRSAFEEGTRLGASPAARLWRRILVFLSRWWQLSSLYDFNVKFRPTWVPRHVCYLERSDLGQVALASARAEGFVSLPWSKDPAQLNRAEALTPVLPPAVAARSTDPAPTAGDDNPYVAQRKQVRQHLLDAGVEPYPPDLAPDTGCGTARLGETATCGGRVLNVRDHGGVVFARLRDWSGDVQLLFDASVCGRDVVDGFTGLVDLGDHVVASGEVMRSRSGERSLVVSHWAMAAKGLRPLPDKHRGLVDPEARVRQRYVDLIANDDARAALEIRSRAIGAIRTGLLERGYLEVETPILQTVHGGANARPFATHINAYDLDLTLRIAPELYLKRLMVGGCDAIFEIGRNFRNEGADATHNPEFTMLEAYRAWGDYASMRVMVRELIIAAARAALGTTLVRGRDADGVVHEVDLAEEWPVVGVHEAVSTAAGVTVTPDTAREELIALCRSLAIAVDPRWTRGQVLLELYEHLVEDRTVAPTFFTDFPADVSPLTRPHRHDDRLAERWDLVAFGAELGTAYTELVDPVLQRERLTEQSLQAAGGDPEAMEIDEDFLTALEVGMPPTGGLGLGLDRVVMMLTGASIRETILFPLVRPRTRP